MPRKPILNQPYISIIVIRELEYFQISGKPIASLCSFGPGRPFSRRAGPQVLPRSSLSRLHKVLLPMNEFAKDKKEWILAGIYGLFFNINYRLTTTTFAGVVIGAMVNG
jgi:hypothetical protein